MRIETLAAHAGEFGRDATGAVTPPIHLSTTFERAPDGSYPSGYVYSRSGNPNRDALERCMADLEGGAAAAAFASGSAATAAVFQALSPGDHVVAPLDAYHGTLRLLREVFGPWGLQVSLVDMSDTDGVAKVLRKETRLVWVESPSNPLLTVTDVAAVAGLAREVGALCACDNTWATPILQRPLELGADLVMHATTKYLGGHGDVLGGAVVAKEPSGVFEKIRKVQVTGGAVAAPFDCWLVLRGIRTLPCRMRVHSENAERVASFLAEHPRVERVYYPGLPSHPGHEVARRQMTHFGGMLSFEVRGGREAAFDVTSKVKVFTRATSLGGTESLIEHRASIEGPGTRAPEGLLRVSIGLEHSDDLIDDLVRALG